MVAQSSVKTLLLTNEYPPHVYGGAGVHVDHLARALAERMAVEVRCFGEQHEASHNPTVTGHVLPDGFLDAAPAGLRSPLDALGRCLSFNATPIDADVVHCHTWYTHLGGVLAKLLHDLPLVVTTHSLEPLRPWKREQLGRGYEVSSWVERTAIEMADAVIAVSHETRQDVLRHFRVDASRVHAVPNGVDVDVYRPVEESDELARFGVPPDIDYVLFVGRVSRQKGILHLLHAMAHLPPEAGVVLCASAPDTPDLAEEVQEEMTRLRARREHVYWIREMVSERAAVQLYAHAALFCCPSIYEPFGIINLEAMACATPVVASAVGGIREVVVDEETGFLVAFERAGSGDQEPRDPAGFARDLAAAMRRLLEDPALARRMGEAGRHRVESTYAWSAVAAQVQSVYGQVISA